MSRLSEVRFFLARLWDWWASLQFTQLHLRKGFLIFGFLIITVYLISVLRRWRWRKSNFFKLRLVRSFSHWPSLISEVLTFLILVLSVVAITVASLEPIAKKQFQIPQKEPVFIAIGLDHSISMLADIEPGVSKSRLEVAKKSIRDLVLTISGREASDKVLLFTFADRPIVLSRDFTSDYSHFFLPQLLLVDDVYARTYGFGTDLSKTLDFCRKVFPKNDYKKFCLIFSDGELEGSDLTSLARNFEESLESWRSSRREIKLYFIAVGSEKKSEPIPKFDFFGNPIGEYEIGENGKPIQTRVNAGLLHKAAVKTGGSFVQLYYTQDKDLILSSLIDEERKVIGSKVQEKVDYVSDYFLITYLVLWSLIFILV